MTRELRTDWYFFNLTLQWFFISYLITYFLLAVTLYQNANYLQLIKCNFEGFFNIYLFNSSWFFYTVVWNKSHSMTSNKTFLNWNPEKSLDIIILTGTKKNWLSSITDLKTRWKQAPVVNSLSTRRFAHFPHVTGTGLCLFAWYSWNVWFSSAYSPLNSCQKLYGDQSIHPTDN